MNLLSASCVLLSVLSRAEAGLRGRRSSKVVSPVNNNGDVNSRALEARRYKYDATGVEAEAAALNDRYSKYNDPSKDYPDKEYGEKENSKTLKVDYCKKELSEVKEKGKTKEITKNYSKSPSKTSSSSKYDTPSGSRYSDSDRYDSSMGSRSSKPSRYIINEMGEKVINPDYHSSRGSSSSRKGGNYGEKNKGGRCAGNKLLEVRDDVFSTPKDTDLPVTTDMVLVNDSNSAGGDLLIDSLGDPQFGTIIMDPNGGDDFTYRPNPGFEGVDTITYEVSDGVNEGTNQGTISVVVGDIDNVAPDAKDDVFSVTSCTSLVVTIDDILGNDVDLNNDDLTVTSYSQPEGGTFVKNPDGGFTYTPSCDYIGTETMTYVVSDGRGGASIGNIIIDVYTGNQPPVANDDSFNVRKGTVAFRITLTDVLGNDVDPEGGELTVSSYTSPPVGILSRVPNGGFVFLPQGFEGTTAFDYTVVDEEGEESTATVTLNVVDVPDNSDPELVDDAYAAVAGQDLYVPEPAVLENDRDPDGDALSISGYGKAANGKVVVNEDGSFVYRAADDFVGVDIFTYDVSDGNGGSASAKVFVNVRPPNAVPIARDDSYTVAKDDKLTVPVSGVLKNDSDEDSENVLKVRENTEPSNGQVEMNPYGSFVYTPNDGFFGMDSFQYTVVDDKGATASATVYVNVNQIPLAEDDSYTTIVNTDLLVAPNGVLKNDVDPDGDVLTIVKFDPPSHGNLVLNADGSFTYRPDDDFIGVDTFTYTVTDGKGGNNSPTVFINVAPTNNEPVARDDSFIALRDTRLTILISDILENDSDPDNDFLYLDSYSEPLNGHVHVDSNGNFVYRSNKNFIGVDTFTYSVTDKNGGMASATVFINVSTAPTAGDDRYSTNQGNVLLIPGPGVLANDKDLDGDDISIVSNTQPSNGYLQTFNKDDGSFVYIPDMAFSGVDSFTYTVSDEDGNTITPTVYITVIRSNSAPQAVDDEYVTPVNTSVRASSPGLLGNDSDADGDEMSVDSYTDTRYGDLVVNDDGSFVYVPNRDFVGTDTFDYVVKDGFGGKATATVTIRINRAPDGNADTYATPKNTLLVVREPGVLENDNDRDGDAMTVISNTNPPNGNVVMGPNGDFQYSPDQGFEGTDTFTYTASDGNGGVVTVPVYVNVRDENVKPTASDDRYVTPFQTDLVITAPGVLSNDVDLNGDGLRIVSNNNAQNGRLDIMPDGSFVYKPFNNFAGEDSFTYTVSDGNGGQDKATVVIKVNKNPNGGDDFYNVGEGDRLGIPPPGLLINDSDPDGDDLTVCGNTKTQYGLLLVGADGSFSYTSYNGFTGKDTFTYTVCDGFGGQSTSTVYITVGGDGDGDGDNTAPNARNDEYSTPKDTSLIISLPGVLANDKDEDSDVLVVESSTQPRRGQAVVQPNGSFIYVPRNGFTGIDTFDYVLSDQRGGVDQATVTITVVDTNRPPVPKDDEIAAFMGRDKTIPISTILANDVDPDSDELNIVDTTDPLFGTLIKSEGFYIYTPEPGYNGPDFFTYAVDDGNGHTVTATVRINVYVPPSATDDRYSVFKNARLTTPSPGVLSNDSADGVALRVTGNTNPEFGTLSQESDGSFLYVPNQGFIGEDSYDYTVQDANGGVSEAKVFITVKTFSVPPMIIPGGGDVIIIGGGGVVNGTSSDCSLNFSNCEGVDTVSNQGETLTASTSNMLFSAAAP